MDYLKSLEAQSIFILREAYKGITPLAMLWSLGKDSSVMIWLARKAFFGHLPMPVIDVDTGKKFARFTSGVQWRYLIARPETS